jgi:hypothetical protein
MKKKDRAWFTCPQWTELVSQHYSSDAEAAQALGTDAKVLARLRSGTPLAKSSLSRILKRYARLHSRRLPIDELMVDSRTR